MTNERAEDATGVVHLRSGHGGTVAEILVESLGGTPPPTREHADALLAFGAVYRNRRRLLADAPVTAGDYLRVHTRPRRFPARDVDWPSRVVAETEGYLVVDKPAGVPVHATLDNARENVSACLGALRGERLLVTQRLDVTTSGLLVLARTVELQRRFNRWLAARLVDKCYRAVTLAAPPVGEHVHFMLPSSRAPRTVIAEPGTGSLECRLRVERVAPLRDGAFEVELRLLTGRTHQIRAQLAALGAPLRGDAMYGGGEGTLRLQSAFLAFPGSGTGYRIGRPPGWPA